MFEYWKYCHVFHMFIIKLINLTIISNCTGRSNCLKIIFDYLIKIFWVVNNNKNSYYLIEVNLFHFDSRQLIDSLARLLSTVHKLWCWLLFTRQACVIECNRARSWRSKAYVYVSIFREAKGPECAFYF